MHSVIKLIPTSRNRCPKSKDYRFPTLMGFDRPMKSTNSEFMLAKRNAAAPQNIVSKLATKNYDELRRPIDTEHKPICVAIDIVWSMFYCSYTHKERG